MSSKRKKIAKANKNEPKNNEMPEIDYPIFDLRYMHPDYSIDTKGVQKDDKVRLISALYKLSKMSWDELRQLNKHGKGTEKIPISRIIPSIPKDIKYDHDFFLVFRYHGTKSMVGFRKGSVFHLLYIDYNYTVYPH